MIGKPTKLRTEVENDSKDVQPAKTAIASQPPLRLVEPPEARDDLDELWENVPV